MQESAQPLTIGFLTVVEDRTGYVGGYLVANRWSRPLEFRLSTPVQPNRVQNILYGSTLKPYLFADLIGKTLVEKSSVPARILFTDCEPALDLRLHLAIPVFWLANANDPLAQKLQSAGANVLPCEAGILVAHPKQPDDVAAARRLLEDAPVLSDLSEPFSRIRDALAEARRLGAANRAA